MYADIVGFQKLSFMNNNNEKIEGTNLFVTYVDESVEGKRADKFFIKRDISFPKDVKIGDTINLVFNQKGKVEAIVK